MRALQADLEGLQGDVVGTPLYPRELMKWSVERMYAPMFDRLMPSHNFTLSEHDYCFGEYKFAGNAQCISRERWVHHTSFLWDFDTFNMKYLLMPEKRPAYRRDRQHSQFLTRLKDYFPPAIAQQEVFYDGVVHQLREMFDVTEVSEEEAREILTRPQERKANSYELL
jgi:lipoate-protein ligase A